MGMISGFKWKGRGRWGEDVTILFLDKKGVRL